MNYKKMSILISVLILLGGGIAYCANSSQSPGSCRNKLKEKGIYYLPLMFIRHAGEGNNDIVDLFLCGGMSPNVRHRNINTPLTAAVRNGHMTIVEKLLDKGADVHPNVYRPRVGLENALMISVRNCDANIAKLLIEHGAIVNQKNKDGKTALDIAKETPCDPNLIKLLENKMQEEKAEKSN